MPEYFVNLRSSEGHPKQELLVNSPAKRKIVKAGRRGGKTVGVARLIVEQFLKGRRIVYGAPTGDQLETCWFEVVNALRDPINAGVYHKDETLHSIELVGTKQRIRLKTAYNADTWRGDYGDLLIFDEWQLMNEDAWQVVGAPMLMDNNGDAVFIYTPARLIAPGRSNVISKARDPGHASNMFKAAREEMKLAEAQGRQSEWLAIEWRSAENPFISKEGLERARDDMTELDYRREIMVEEIADEDMVLREEWLRFYRYRPSEPNKPLNDPTNYLLIEHDPKNDETGQVLFTPEALLAGYLEIRIIVDPNHAGKHGRCKHAITVVGFDAESGRFYLMDEWAESCGYRDFGEKIFEMCGPRRWHQSEVWIETVASQVYCKLYLEELNLKSPYKITFRDLPTDNRANAKDRRIEGLEPYFRNGRFWVHPSQRQFKFEYGSYYRGKHIDVDVLDTLGYAPQLYTMQSKKSVVAMLQKREELFKGRNVGATGY